MARKRELTWHKARGVWRKKWNGKVYYLSKAGECKGERDEAGYERARKAWSNIRLGLGPDMAPATATATATSPEPPDDSTGGLSFYKHDREPLPGESTEVKTLEGAITAYLAEKRKLVEKKKRGPSWHREAKDKLATFQAFAAKHKRAKMFHIDSNILEKYREETIELPPNLKADGTPGKRISPYTAKKRLVHVKLFMEYAYRKEWIETLPRVIDKTYIAIDLPETSPKEFVFTVDQVKELFKYSSQRTRLYIALGINCAYGPQDIATLTHGHICVENDDVFIHRKRNKSGSPQHHKLWKVTQELLKAEMTEPTDDTALALLDKNGKPLVVEELDTHTAKTNPIGRAFDRARKRADFHREKAGLAKRWQGNRKGIKCLRKTGAQTLEDQFEDFRIVKQYLGHKEKDVAKVYREESTRSLFDALDWMEGLFDLASVKVSGETEAVA
jgi:hypothetical protein